MDKNAVTIIGAGLVGSLLASFLAKRGFQVNIFEKRHDMRKTQMSAGRSINLSLSIRGIKALEKINLMDKIEPHLTPMHGRQVHPIDASENFQPYGQFEHCVHYSISRGELNKILMDEAQSTGKVNFYFDHELEQVDLENKTAQFKVYHKAFEHHYDKLFATDGAFSKVRDAMIGKCKGGQSVAALDHGYKELTMPANTDGSHQIRRDVLHIWPRDNFMLIALPNTDGSFTVTLFLSHQGKISFESLNSPQQVNSFFEQYFPDLLNLIPDAVEQFIHNPVGQMVTVKALPWHYQDSALLVGDAAHAIVPFHGQGMNCGFEDCDVLDGLISCYDSWETIFDQFEQLRKPNSDAIADMALENYVEMRSLVSDPKFLLKKKIAFELERLYPEKFTPRYQMVMFDVIPYHEAYMKGVQHERLLEVLANNANRVEEVDFDKAKLLLSNPLREVI